MKRDYNYVRTLVHNLVFACCAAQVFGQPTADFNATPIAGCAPLVVNFTDLSTGNPTSWSWDLGNNTASSLRSPSTTYIQPGLYTVMLTVGNAQGSNSITKTAYIKVYGKPVVSFKVNDSADCAPHSCQFTDLSSTSIGSINSWQWDFDDGSSSTLQNPSHIFSAARNYNVSLRVTNDGGCVNVLNKLAYIKIAPPLIPSLSFTKPVLCKPPEAIQFTNGTHGPGILQYTWDFGDGGTSTIVSPMHLYTASGRYTIKLFVENDLGCADTLALTDTVSIKNNQPIISSLDTICINKMMFFTNASIPTPLTSKWVFDNEGTGFGSTIAKTWATTGQHIVKLITNFGGCSDSVTKTITVLSPPIVSFTLSNNTSCRAPLNVHFSDASVGAIYWRWDFGDGSTSTLANPSHSYTTPGKYNVSLTATNAPGCDKTYTHYLAVKIVPPTIAINTREGGGCIPYLFRPYPSITTIDDIASYFWDFGNGHTSVAPYPAVLYTDSGTYTIKLVVTSNSGCSDSLIIDSAVRTGNRPFADFSSSTNEICPRTDVAFTNFSIPSDKWEWHFGDELTSSDKNSIHQYLDSGYKSVKLIAWNNGCSDSIAKTNIIRVLPGLSRFRPVFNCTNKREVYFKDSSILPQSWFWDFGDSTFSTEPNPTHLFTLYKPYQVKLTTVSSGCTNTDSIKVNLINETADFSVQKTSVCRQEAFVLTTKNVNGEKIAKYVWDFGDGDIDSTTMSDSLTHHYQQEGIYTVSLTITDNNGCTSSITKNNLIKVTEPHAAFSFVGAGGCTNETVNFIDSSTGSIARRYWDFGDGRSRLYIANSPPIIPHVYSNVGQYYPMLVVTDSSGCIDSVSYSVPIGIYKPIVDFAVANNDACRSDTLKFENLCLGESLTYTWYFGDGSISFDSAATKQYSLDGNYTPTLVATDQFGCTDSVSKTDYIKVRTVVASFSVSDTVGLCVPYRIDFTNTSVNATSTWWEFGDGGYSEYPNPLYYYSSTGVYYAKLFARRSNTCFSTDSVRIRVSAPSGTLNYNSQTGCAPITVHFNVATNDSVSYIWDFNDGTSYTSNDSAVTYTYNLPGDFVPRVILRDSRGCAIPLFSTDTISLYHTKVNFASESFVICSGEAVQFIDSSFSGSPVILRQWDFGDGNYSNETNPLHHYSAPGNYPVKLFITTRYGCRDSLIKTNYVQAYKKPEINIGGYNPEYCGPASINFTGIQLSNDSNTVTWHWNFGNGNTASTQNPPMQLLANEGNYTIELTASLHEGCADTAIASIFVKTIPNVIASNDTIVCAGSTVQLNATGADTYDWQCTVPLSCNACSHPVVSPQTDIYAYVTGKSSGGCEKKDSVYITTKKPIVLTGAIDAVICSGHTTQLSIAGAEQYIWSPPTGLNNHLISSPLASPTASTTYKVVGYDSLHCFMDSALVTIEVYKQPYVNIGNDFNHSTGEPIILSPLYSEDITIYQWENTLGLSCYDCPSPYALPLRNTTYKVEVSNKGGCKASDEINIFVRCDKSSISMPTAFSPNNDGRNDRFTPLGRGNVTVSSFKIFNRMGQMIFNKGNFRLNDAASGWDGTFKGEGMAAGNYIYSIEFVCGNNDVSVVNGSVMLLR